MFKKYLGEKVSVWWEIWIWSLGDRFELFMWCWELCVL